MSAEANAQTEEPLAERVLFMFRVEYIKSGYLYAGCLSPHWVARQLGVEEAAVMSAIEELTGRGLVRRRRCEAFKFELSGTERVRLINEHRLNRAWEEGEGRVFYPNSSHGEVTYAYRAAEAEAERAAAA